MLAACHNATRSESFVAQNVGRGAVDRASACEAEPKLALAPSPSCSSCTAARPALRLLRCCAGDGGAKAPPLAAPASGPDAPLRFDAVSVRWVGADVGQGRPSCCSWCRMSRSCFSLKVCAAARVLGTSTMSVMPQGRPRRWQHCTAAQEYKLHSLQQAVDDCASATRTQAAWSGAATAGPSNS